MNREQNRRPNCATGVCGGHLPVPFHPKRHFLQGTIQRKAEGQENRLNVCLWEK